MGILRRPARNAELTSGVGHHCTIERPECTQHRPAHDMRDELRITNNGNESWKRLRSNMGSAADDDGWPYPGSGTGSTMAEIQKSAAIKSATLVFNMD